MRTAQQVADKTEAGKDEDDGPEVYRQVVKEEARRKAAEER